MDVFAEEVLKVDRRFGIANLPPGGKGPFRSTRLQLDEFVADQSPRADRGDDIVRKLYAVSYPEIDPCLRTALRIKDDPVHPPHLDPGDLYRGTVLQPGDGIEERGHLIVVAADKLHLAELDGKVGQADDPDQHENPDNGLNVRFLHGAPERLFKVQGSRS